MSEDTDALDNTEFEWLHNAYTCSCWLFLGFGVRGLEIVTQQHVEPYQHCFSQLGL